MGPPNCFFGIQAHHFSEEESKLWNGILQGINISHLGKRKLIFKTALERDMLVPRRVWMDDIGFFIGLLACFRKCEWVPPEALQAGITVDWRGNFWVGQQHLSVVNKLGSPFGVFVKWPYTTQVTGLKWLPCQTVCIFLALTSLLHTLHTHNLLKHHRWFFFDHLL